MSARVDLTEWSRTPATDRVRDAATAAKHGMFRTCDVMDEAKSRRDEVAMADARTSMCDYRLALALAMGRSCDRNGYGRAVT